MLIALRRTRVTFGGKVWSKKNWSGSMWKWFVHTPKIFKYKF